LGDAGSKSPDEVWELHPADYDDRVGWDLYHKAYSEARMQFSIHRLMIDMIPLMDKKDIIVSYGRRIWFPGCGISLVPHLFAAWGAEVYATDFSAEAIHASKLSVADPQIGELLPLEKFPREKWSLDHRLHDFRDPFDVNNLDIVINMKSYSELTDASRAKAARTHFEALRDGGLAVFVMWNTDKDRIMACRSELSGVGFKVSAMDFKKRSSETDQVKQAWTIGFTG